MPCVRSRQRRTHSHWHQVLVAPTVEGVCCWCGASVSQVVVVVSMAMCVIRNVLLLMMLNIRVFLSLTETNAILGTGSMFAPPPPSCRKAAAVVCLCCIVATSDVRSGLFCPARKRVCCCSLLCKLLRRLLLPCWTWAQVVMAILMMTVAHCDNVCAAGDGEVTLRMSYMFTSVTATEVSARM
jgi:hypothetical protein